MPRRTLTAAALLAVLAVAPVASARRIAVPAPQEDIFIVPQLEPTYVGSNLSENRHGRMPQDTAQLVAFYDGDPSAHPELRLQCQASNGEMRWLTLAGLPRSSQSGPGRVATGEFRMNGCVPTGVVEVSGAVPDGVIDGVAFGMLYRDRAGRFHSLRSQSDGSGLPRMVGMWPLQISDAQFAALTPQITSDIARAQAKASLFGAEYLSNGRHRISLPFSWTHVNQPTQGPRPYTRCGTLEGARGPRC